MPLSRSGAEGLLDDACVLSLVVVLLVGDPGEYGAYERADQLRGEVGEHVGHIRGDAVGELALPETKMPRVTAGLMCAPEAHAT